MCACGNDDAWVASVYTCFLQADQTSNGPGERSKQVQPTPIECPSQKVTDSAGEEGRQLNEWVSEKETGSRPFLLLPYNETLISKRNEKRPNAANICSGRFWPSASTTRHTYTLRQTMQYSDYIFGGVTFKWRETWHTKRESHQCLYMDPLHIGTSDN